MKIVALVTGGFDPIHSGHIKYLQKAKKLSNILVVGVNSDAWLIRKKGAAFMPWSERSEIVRHIRGVQEVISFNDSDGSACDAIRKVREMYPGHKIIFCNGGDRTKENIPEMSFEDDNIEFVFGVGGEEKANSSSWILAEWKAPKTERAWGYYRVLHEDTGVKVKELTVDPHCNLSMQRHEHRSEYWLVATGSGIVRSYRSDGHIQETNIEYHDEYAVPEGDWHQLINNTEHELRIIEIQYGDRCVEEDIERRDDAPPIKYNP